MFGNQKIRFLFFVMTFLMMGSLFFVSCGKEKTMTEKETICFVDALGREVCVEKEPERVAALLGSFADVWMLSGGTLCAAAEDAGEDFGLPLEDAISLGGAHSPSLELLIAAEPDFVLASASTASNLEMKETLEALEIPVAYFEVDHFEDYLHMLDICTDITGKKEFYEKNGLQIAAQIEKIRTQYANENPPEEMRTVLLLRASSTKVKAKGSEGTILGEMLFDMGCINLADNDQSLLENLSVEAVIRKEPYHIFVVTMGNDTEAAKRSVEQMMNENPAWSTLKAVREGRFHQMDKQLFNLKPNAKWAEAYQKLYEILTTEKN